MSAQGCLCIMTKVIPKETMHSEDKLGQDVEQSRTQALLPTPGTPAKTLVAAGHVVCPKFIALGGGGNQSIKLHVSI